MYDDHKFRRIRFYWSALMDGVFNVFDNSKPRNILYKDL